MKSIYLEIKFAMFKLKNTDRNNVLRYSTISVGNEWHPSQQSLIGFLFFLLAITVWLNLVQLDRTLLSVLYQKKKCSTVNFFIRT